MTNIASAAFFFVDLYFYVYKNKKALELARAFNVFFKAN